MKNKRNIYILLAMVLTIWGFVVYQFFSFSTDTFENSDQVETANLKPLSIKARDTAAIKLGYRDPFLGKMYVDGPVKIRRKTTSVKKEPVIREPVVFPKIVFKGIVSDTKEKNRIFMLIINGRTFLMKKGEIENEVLLKDGNKESVIIKYKGVEQSVPLQA